jgi:hypothetical protein
MTDFHTAETELELNTDLTRAIHAMTQEIHAFVKQRPQPSDLGDINSVE